jgi:hypothetical protein
MGRKMNDETELDFLLDILLEHKLEDMTKQRLKERIKRVQMLLVSKPVLPMQSTYQAPLLTNHVMMQQAPSTIAKMIQHGMMQPADTPTAFVPAPPSPPVPPVVLSGVEAQARQNSMEILKKKRQH